MHSVLYTNICPGLLGGGGKGSKVVLCVHELWHSGAALKVLAPWYTTFYRGRGGTLEGTMDSFNDIGNSHMAIIASFPF